MKTWEDAIYRGNNMRLMKCHIAVAILYAVLVGGIAATVLTKDRWWFLFLMPGAFVFLHLLLAYGSYRKVELSRKTSVVVFLILAIGTIPIGTLLAIFVFLPATQWQAPSDS
jgi:hypothetical protein